MAYTIDHLKKRSKRAWDIAEQWHTIHKEVYRYSMPERYSKLVSGPMQRPWFNEIFDRTASDAVEDFASFITEALYPFDQPWLRFSPRQDLSDRDRQKLKPIAEEFTSRINFLFNNSNFHPSQFSANKDLAVGTKLMRVEEDPNQPGKILFTPLEPYKCAVEVDGFDRYAGVHIKVKDTYRDLYARYRGGMWSAEWMKCYEQHPDKEASVCESLLRDPLTGIWHSCAYEEKGETLIIEGEYLTPPIIVTRWARTAGVPWGVGPTMRALPDIKTANKTVELVLKNAAIAVTGIWLVDDDGVINPANIRLVPGALIPKSPNSTGLTALAAPGRFDVSQLVLDDMRMSIKRTHFAKELPEREMTAFEASERVRQQQRQLRGVFGQLMAEDIVPTVDRVIDLARQIGAIPADLDDKLFNIELVGPLAQAVQEMEAERMMNYVGRITAMYGPVMAFAATKPEQMLPDMAEKMGVSHRYVANKEELAVLRERVSQQAASQVQQGAPDGVAGPGAAPGAAIPA